MRQRSEAEQNGKNEAVYTEGTERTETGKGKCGTGLFRDTMEKTVMSPERTMEIRTELEAADGKKHRIPKLVGVAAAAVLMLAVMPILPAGRSLAAEAIRYMQEIFHMANGGEVVYEQNEAGNQITFRITAGEEDKEYAQVENGRLYCVIGDTKEDVTDQCSETAYVRREVKNEDGSKSVILVGGTPEEPGWVELMFDAQGNYVFNSMKVSPDRPAWVSEAMHAEGVPSGDSELDEELTEDENAVRTEIQIQEETE